MPEFIIILLVAVAVFAGIFIFSNRFYSDFLKTARKIRNESGLHPDEPITENDLKNLPLPVGAYIRASGFVGRKKISYMHLTHSGTFRPGADRQFVPIKGEYFLTTRKPSFCWFGKISLFPRISVSAMDYYYNGAGRMLVKLLSLVSLVNENSKETGMSAFGRCIAEMTLIPSFFLDNERIRWTSYDLSHAACTITDAGFATDAQLYFNADGTLDSIEVGRYYDRRNGQFSHEKFTGKSKSLADYNGLKIPSVIDGYWNLKEGDLHYVHFLIGKVEFE